MKFEKIIKYLVLVSAIAYSAFYLNEEFVARSQGFGIPSAFILVALLLALFLAVMGIRAFRYSLYSAALIALFGPWAWPATVVVLVLLGLREKYLTCKTVYAQVKDKAEKDVKNVVFVGAVLLCGLLLICIGFTVDWTSFGISSQDNFIVSTFSSLLLLLVFLLAVWAFALVWMTVMGRNKKIAFQYSLYAMALLVVPCGFIFAPIVLMIMGVREKIIIYKSDFDKSVTQMETLV